MQSTCADIFRTFKSNQNDSILLILVFYSKQYVFQVIRVYYLAV